MWFLRAALKFNTCRELLISRREYIAVKDIGYYLRRFSDPELLDG